MTTQLLLLRFKYSKSNAFKIVLGSSMNKLYHFLFTSWFSGNMQFLDVFAIGTLKETRNKIISMNLIIPIINIQVDLLKLRCVENFWRF